MRIRRRTIIDKEHLDVLPEDSIHSKRWYQVLLVFNFLIIASAVVGQTYDAPFKNGERVLYGTYYNWQFVWIQSGEVEFTADTCCYEGKNVWHLKATGKTFNAYDYIYSIRDTFEAYTGFDDFRPILFRRFMSHGRTKSFHRYLFNDSTNQIFSEIHRHHQAFFKDTLFMPYGIHDMLSSAYSFRDYGFNGLKKGQKVSFKMLVDNEIFDLHFNYLGKENITTRNGKEYRCHKVSVYLLKGDFFNEGEYMKIWFTDDENKVPVQVETEVLVGSVKALLIDTKNLKYPLTSEIN